MFLPHDRLSLNGEKVHKDQFLLLDNEEARAVKIIFLSLSCQLSMPYSLRFFTWFAGPAQLRSVSKITGSASPLELKLPTAVSSDFE